MKADQPAQSLLKAQRKLIILPVGACEQHGPYLPIDTDLRIAQLIAEKLESKTTENECLLLPAIPFSCSWEHKGTGTIALSHTTIVSIIHDIAYNLKAWADPNLFILLNWHGGNNFLSSLAAEITAKENIPTIAVNAISETSMMWARKHREDDIDDIHAGGLETAIIKAYWPDLVDNNIPKSAKYQVPVSPSIMHFALQAFNTRSITRDGIWGDPSLAKAEEGKDVIEKVTQNIYNNINEVLTFMDKVKDPGEQL